MFGATPPWMNFLLGANDKFVTPQNPFQGQAPRTSYGTPRPVQKVTQPSQPGPNIGRMTRDPNAIPTPNMGILPALFNPGAGQVY